MLVDFNILPSQSRVWVYAIKQKLINNQENYVLNCISNHIKKWVAHKLPLSAGVTVLENHFIVVALDESINSASGCSIDALQNIINELEKELSISLTNRLNVFCVIDGVISCIPAIDLAFSVNKDTLFYDLTIQKKSELSNWLKPIKEGWCYSFLK